MKIEKTIQESNFEYKLRLCLAKLNKEVDLDWSEIVELIGEKVSADHLRKTAYGYLDYHNYIHNNIDVHNRILSISDTHVPFQLPITIFKDYVGQVDTLQLNGDILDCQSLSKFPKTYRVSMIEEMITGRQYIIDLINYIRPKKVIITYGNHEVRYQAYIAKTMGEDMAQLMPQTALDLICTDGFYFYDKRNKTKTWYEPLCKVFEEVEVIYTENWYCQIGDTIFCHPSAFSSGIMKTAEKAMYWFRNEGFNFKTLVMAHTHRIGKYIIGNSTIYEQGTCSDTKKQTYADGKLYNSQQEGFIYLCQDKDGNTIESKTKLISLKQ